VDQGLDNYENDFLIDRNGSFAAMVDLDYWNRFWAAEESALNWRKFCI
jgi:hypothetical protein